MLVFSCSLRAEIQKKLKELLGENHLIVTKQLGSAYKEESNISFYKNKKFQVSITYEKKKAKRVKYQPTTKEELGNSQKKYVLIGQDKNRDRLPRWIFISLPAEGKILEINMRGEVKSITYQTPWEDSRSKSTYVQIIKSIYKKFSPVKIIEGKKDD